MCPINPLSYGLVGWNILKTLMDQGHDVALFPIDIHNPNDRQKIIEWHLSHISKDPNFINGIAEKYLFPAMQKKFSYDYDAPTIRIFHQHLLQESVGKGERIGFPIFELNKFSDQEKNSLKGVDYVFVPTQWAQNIIHSEIDKACFVVPLGVDHNIFKPSVEPQQIIRDPKTETVFFLPGKLEVRKCHDIIHDIFAKAFNKNDVVELWLCPHSFFVDQNEMQDWIRLYKNSPLGDKIKILPRLQTQVELAQIMAQADCVLSISRAEGWDLPCLEAIAMGKPVIATNYSGHTEFCHEHNSYLVNIDELEDAYDGKFFFNQGQWAHIGDNQIEQIVNHMRHIHMTKERDNDDFMKGFGRVGTTEKFSWHNTVEKLILALENF